MDDPLARIADALERLLEVNEQQLELLERLCQQRNDQPRPAGLEAIVQPGVIIEATDRLASYQGVYYRSFQDMAEFQQRSNWLIDPMRVLPKVWRLICQNLPVEKPSGHILFNGRRFLKDAEFSAHSTVSQWWLSDNILEAFVAAAEINKPRGYGNVMDNFVKDWLASR